MHISSIILRNDGGTLSALLDMNIFNNKNTEYSQIETESVLIDPVLKREWHCSCRTKPAFPQRWLCLLAKDTLTCRTSELRGPKKETDPQQDRVEFKQVMILCVEDILANGLESWDNQDDGYKQRLASVTSLTCQQLVFLAASMTCSLAPGQRRTWQGKKTRTSVQMKINQTSVQTLEHLFL